MLYLPNCIEIQLESDAPEVVCGVLVAIHFSIDGRYYYGTLVGLTDVNGVAPGHAGEDRARLQRGSAILPDGLTSTVEEVRSSCGHSHRGRRQLCRAAIGR